MFIKIRLNKQNKVLAGNHTEFCVSIDANTEQEYLGQIIPRNPTYKLLFKNETIALNKKQANNLISFLSKTDKGV